jgi:2-polyprenyl-6-methoxyphenol hydroxylase-like FAD-dependent oxidoreductase
MNGGFVCDPTAFHNTLVFYPLYTHREFSYCHTLTGTQLHRIDHFRETPRWFWQESPSNIAHLAQNKVEVALREEVIHATAESAHHLLGYNVTAVDFGKNSSIVTARGCAPGTEDQTLQVACKYLVAADGSNSFIRSAAGIAMKGDEAMQHLVNVHFSCPGLRNQLQPTTAMLYFTFNEVRLRKTHTCKSCSTPLAYIFHPSTGCGGCVCGARCLL